MENDHEVLDFKLNYDTGHAALLESPYLTADTTVQWPPSSTESVTILDSVLADVDMNTTEFTSGKDDTYLRHESMLLTVIYCVSYSLVFVVGLVGNSFVVAVVHRSPRMRTVTNLFIVNLALADILVVVFCLPATLIGNIFKPWLLGLFMCKTVSYLQGVSVIASINTLVAISVDRFLAICYPMKWQITTRVCRVIIVIIWIFSIVITLPWAMYFTLAPMHEYDTDLLICTEIWPSQRVKVIHFLLFNLGMCYLLPLSVITVCYVFIWFRVWRRKLPGETKDHLMDQMIQKSKIKVVKMLFAVVVLFAVSWLPLYAIVTRIEFGKENFEGEEYVVEVAMPVAQWLGSSNSCINPVLYAYMNSKFRAGFKALLTDRRCCGPLRYEHSPYFTSSTFRSNSTAASKISKTSKTSSDRRATLVPSHNSNVTPV